jgi:hypothetical protein
MPTAVQPILSSIKHSDKSRSRGSRNCGVNLINCKKHSECCTSMHSTIILVNSISVVSLYSKSIHGRRGALFRSAMVIAAIACC